MPAPKNNKTILIAPLDWGLGHATRCIPVIREFLKQDCQVLIGASGSHAALLQQEFPQLTILPLPGYHIRYGKGNLILQLLRQLPQFLKTIRQEHQWLKAALQEYRIDAVISDNRYGLYAPGVPCVLITHQLQVQAPRWLQWTQQMVQKKNYQMIGKFGECWVPDVADAAKSLAGSLSHPAQKPAIPVKYIGWLTRFQPLPVQSIKKYHLLISLSGPEPQRTLLENLLLRQLPVINEPVLLVRGLPQSNKRPSSPNTNLEIANHLSGTHLQEAIAQSGIFLSRCGYSTLMDLQTASCRCIFIPTPGQTEQEYLGREIANKGKAIVMQQADCNLSQALQQAASIATFSSGNYQNEYLKTIIADWLATVGEQRLM